jgi:ubiquinone/menaquinone biosynthesis C-methylase UbiE
MRDRGERTRRFAVLGLGLLLGMGALRCAPAEEEAAPRRPAEVMSYRAWQWLERESREEEELPDEIVAAMELEAGQTVADIGSGSGYFTRRLARAVGPEGTVFGVEIQPEMIEIMMRLAEDEGIENITPVLGEANDPKLPEESVDWILLVDTYHEFQEPEAMLAAMRRALKPEGRVALIEYRLEGDSARHIKLDHRMSVKQVLAEWNPAGYELVDLMEFLPSQHFFVFRKRE